MCSRKKSCNLNALFSKILLSQSFETPEKAFAFFDKNGDAHLSKNELKDLLKVAGVGGFISKVAAKQMIKGLDKSKDKKLNWSEFKKAVDALMSEAK